MSARSAQWRGRSVSGTVITCSVPLRLPFGSATLVGETQTQHEQTGSEGGSVPALAPLLFSVLTASARLVQEAVHARSSSNARDRAVAEL